MKNTQTDNAIKWPQMKQKIAKETARDATDIIVNGMENRRKSNKKNEKI